MRLEQDVSRILFPPKRGRLFILPLDCSRDRSTYPPHETGRLVQGQFGLSPDGVYQAPDVTTRTVSSYLTFSPLPLEMGETPISGGGVFSVALSSDRSESLLATILPCGVRTFLPFTLYEKKEQPPRLLQPLFLCRSALTSYKDCSAECRSLLPSERYSSYSPRV